MKPQHNIDYVLIDSDDGETTGIGIQTGKYAGVLYHYGKVRISEEGELARMIFSYTIVSTPKFSVEELTHDEEFHTYIGDILTDILVNEEAASRKIEEDEVEEIFIEKP